jgi:hypothetical protein
VTTEVKTWRSRIPSAAAAAPRGACPVAIARRSPHHVPRAEASRGEGRQCDECRAGFVDLFAGQADVCDSGRQAIIIVWHSFFSVRPTLTVF